MILSLAMTTPPPTFGAKTGACRQMQNFRGSCSLGSVSGQGSSGYYWSSTPDDSNLAYYLYFHSSGQESNGSHKKFGNSVRAVLKE